MKENINNPIRDASILVGKAIVYQEQNDFANSKPLIKLGIDKIRKSLLSDGNPAEKDLVLECYSLFEKMYQNASLEEEYYKNR